MREKSGAGPRRSLPPPNPDLVRAVPGSRRSTRRFASEATSDPSPETLKFTAPLFLVITSSTTRTGSPVTASPARSNGTAPQRLVNAVYDVARDYVLRIAATCYDQALFAGVERKHGDLVALGRTVRDDVEEDGVAAGQEFRPSMVHFLLEPRSQSSVAPRCRRTRANTHTLFRSGPPTEP